MNVPKGEWISLTTVAKPEWLEAVSRQDPALIAHIVRGLDLQFEVRNERMLFQSLCQEAIEPELLDFIDDLKPGCVFVDVGASIGNFAAYAMKRGLCVIAVEPDDANFRALQVNMSLNVNSYQSNCFELLNRAAWSKETELALRALDLSPGAHQKSIRPRGGNTSEDKIQMSDGITLDSIARSNIAQNVEQIALKVDADGAEFEVLAGARAVFLQDARLQGIFIELENGSETADRCSKVLKQAGFRISKRHSVARNPHLSNVCFARDF